MAKRSKYRLWVSRTLPMLAMLFTASMKLPIAAAQDAPALASGIADRPQKEERLSFQTQDPYLPRVLSEETARDVRGLHTWITSEYEHNGLRADGDRILSRLIDLVRGRA